MKYAIALLAALWWLSPASLVHAADAAQASKIIAKWSQGAQLTDEEKNIAVSHLTEEKEKLAKLPPAEFRKQMLNSIDQMAQAGQISEEQVAQARQFIGALPDAKLAEAKEQAIKQFDMMIKLIKG